LYSFDFIYEQAGETLRLAMDVRIFRDTVGKGSAGSSRRGGSGPVRGPRHLNDLCVEPGWAHLEHSAQYGFGHVASERIRK